MKIRNLLTFSLLTTAPAWADYKSTVLTDNPSGYWRLNAAPWISYATNRGSAGSTADGVIGSLVREGLPGAIAGDANPAMQFIGNGNSRIVVPYDANLNPYGSYTFECWMNSACPKGNALAVVVNRSGESGYTIYVNGDGTFGFNISKGAGGGYWSSISITNTAFAPLVGQWVHIACVYDASASANGTQYIYTNGVLGAQMDLNNPPVPNPNGPFILGDRNFVGLLDEVAVYPSALDATTLLAHYRAGTNGVGNYPATVQASSPVAYWRLDETGGFATPPTLANNLGTLGTPAKGTYGGATALQAAGALTGNANPAASFSGGNVAVPRSPGLNPSGAFTAEAWLKPGVAMVGAGLTVPLSSGHLASPRSGWLIYQSATGWNFRTYNENTTVTAVNIEGGGAPVVNAWHHVVAVWDGTVGRVYVNGVLGATSAATTFVANPDGPLTIGDRSDFGGYAWTGSADEVALYPSALDANTIKAHFDAATTNAAGYAAQILAASPRGYWRLDDVTVPSMTATNLGYIGSLGSGTFNGSTMVVTSDTPLLGDSDPAAYFPGSSRIDIPLNEALVRTNAFSYEIWYKENPGVTGIKSPMWWRDEPSGGDTRGWVHYLQDLTGGRGHNFQSSSTKTTWDGMWCVPAFFAQDEWQHLVCTFDGLIKQIFLDGVLVQSSTNDPRFIKLVQRAACSISSGSYPFSGFLDEAAYYTNALSAARIQAHWTAARGTNPPAVVATFESQPAGLTAFEGSAVSVKAVVLGTPPFNYQWYLGATPVPGQTTATLTLLPAMQAQTGDYTLWVTNSGGVASSDPAHVEIVAAPPSIVMEPQAATRLQGASATFTVQASGSEPLHYQWKSNSVPIAGATSAGLTLANIQPSFGASYSVSITNTAGATNSQAASLTVLAVAPGSYAASVVTAQPMAFWRLDETNGETAYDLVGGHDGTYDPGIVLDQPGAILGDSDPSVNFPSWAGVQIPWSAALNPAGAFTVECWAKTDELGAGSTRTIFSSRNREISSQWHFGYYLCANSTDQWQFNTGQKTSGVNGLASGTADTNWHHVVAVYDNSTETKYLYVDGQLAASTTVPANTFGPNVGAGPGNDDPPPTNEGIGTTVAEDRYSGQGVYFYGNLDEVAVYNYALTAAQVAQHYGVGGPPVLSITPSGNKVVVSWTKGLLLQSSELNGPWTTNSAAISPLLYTPTGTRQFFRAIVP
jgi:hypothetical protein